MLYNMNRYYHASIWQLRILSHEGGVLWGFPTAVVLAGSGHPQHFDGGVKFVPCICTLYWSLSRRQNEMAAMPSKIIVMLSTNATVYSCRAKTLAPNWKSYSSIQQTLRANLSPWQMLHKFSRGHMQLKIPLLLQLKPWKILLSRSLSRHHNKMVVMPSKIIVMLSTNATEVSSQMKILRPHFSDILSTFVLTRTYTEAFTHRSIYTQTLLHTDAFTHRRFYTQTYDFTHRRVDTFTHKRFYTQTLWHTNVRFYTQTPWHFYTQTLLHTNTFTHRRKYTQRLLHTNTFTHRRFYTQTHLHTDTFTHKHFYTQTLLHTDAFTHRRFYTQTLLRTNAFTHRRFYTQTLLHTDAFTHKHFEDTLKLQFSSVFDGRTSFRAKGFAGNTTSQFFPSFWRSNLISCERVARDDLKSQFYLSFWRSNIISCERVRRKHEIAIFPQFLTIAKGLPRTPWNRNFSSVFDDRTSFRAKGLRGQLWNRNFTSVFDDRTSFRAKGLRGTTWNRNFTSVFDDRTSFRAKGLRLDLGNRNFTSVFDDRTSFRAKG